MVARVALVAVAVVVAVSGCVASATVCNAVRVAVFQRDDGVRMRSVHALSDQSSEDLGRKAHARSESASRECVCDADLRR